MERLDADVIGPGRPVLLIRCWIAASSPHATMASMKRSKPPSAKSGSLKPSRRQCRAGAA